MAAKLGKGGEPQQKAQPQYEETLGQGRYQNRQAEEVQEASPKKIRAARKAHHGKSVSADGSKFVEPLKKAKTSGGNGGE